jgi:hypothetical protein
MNKWLFSAFPAIFLALGGCAAALAAPATEECTSAGDLHFLCGIRKPEDLLPLPGGRWIVASGMEPKSGLHLIDTKAKRWEKWIAPATASSPSVPFGGCTSAPGADDFQAHGMSLRARPDGSATLYVVNHGGAEPIRDFAMGGPRETIEVFNVVLAGDRPTLTWAGCLPLPPGLVANSVTSGPDGSVYATVLLHPGNLLSDLWKGKATGGVYKWSLGKVAFERVVGTELTGNNGIEISRDGSKIFVSSFSHISMFSNTNPAKRIKSVKIPHGIGDNIHWVGDRLIVAGTKLHRSKRATDGTPVPDGYYVASVEPRSLRMKMIAEGAHIPSFDGVSVGIPVGTTLWLGSHSSNRIGYRQLTEGREP